MEHTLKLCEMQPKGGEIKCCATSLESMLNSTQNVLGLETKVLATITHSLDNTTLLQDYTILEAPQEIEAPRMVACHTVRYPYAVFYCHNQKSENKVFKVLLIDETGDREEAVAVCHMDTSK